MIGRLAVSWLLLLATALPGAEEDAWLRPLVPPPQPPAEPDADDGDGGDEAEEAEDPEDEPRVTYPGVAIPPGAKYGGPQRSGSPTPPPPVLVAKLIWGEDATFTWETGKQVAVSDWNQCPDDIQGLLGVAGERLGVTFRHREVSLADFDLTPRVSPLLVVSGSRRIRLDDGQRQDLRRFVQDGGMLVFDTIAGSPWFHQAAVAEVAAMFPERRLRAVPLDHPLFHMVHDASSITLRGSAESEVPRMQAIVIGSRIGALISPYGLGTGWAGRDVHGIEQAAWYAPDDARRIGTNLVAYAVGSVEPGRIEARPELHGSVEEDDPGDRLLLGQIRHDGGWDVHPGATASLLMRARSDLALDVAVRRVAVDLERDELAPFGILYLTAIDDFAFSEAEIAALRGFLDGHGTLVVNNGLGLASSDRVLRREIARVVGDDALVPVPEDHPIFQAAVPLERVRYTTAVLATEPDLDRPVLEAVERHGDLRLIYSPYSIEAAWLGCEYPLARAWRGVDGVRMGLNLLVYAATH